MRRRWAIGFPYLLFTAIVCLVAYDNLGHPSDVRTHTVSDVTAVDPICGMTVNPATAIKHVAAKQTVYFCMPACRDRYLEEMPRVPSRGDQAGGLRDPVCNMDVNPAWGFQTDLGGATYYFCSDRCRERFVADPAQYTGDRCAVCNASLAGIVPWTATYQDKTYSLCSEEHRVAFLADPASFFLHQMWGIPPGMYYGSIAAVLVVSFVGFEWRGRHRERARAGVAVGLNARYGSNGTTRAVVQHSPVAVAAGGGVATLAPPAPPVVSETLARDLLGEDGSAPRFDLLRYRWLHQLLTAPPTRFVAQAGIASIFLLIIVAGLFGNQNPALNIAPIVTWTIWWGGLVVLIMLAGKAWCYVCPWDALASWIERGRPWGKGPGSSLGLEWPRALRNIWPATLLFVGLTWIELGWGVTTRPRVTAYLALAMFALAFVSVLLFDRKAFCRYGCLVGRVSGLYALFSGLELRARDRAVCKGCRTKDCYRGNERGDGCPTFEFTGAMELNTYCVLCGECLKTCPVDNIGLNLRPWGADLVKRGRPRSDEAYLALLMLAITAFHGLTMTPNWINATEQIRRLTHWPAPVVFSIGMTAIMIGPIAIYAALVGVSRLVSTDRTLPYRVYFIRYAYALLPIALFYHLAHNAEHLLMEGPKVLRLLSDPLGFGWNLFGTGAWSTPPLISLSTLWYVQVALVLVGHVYSLWVAERTAAHLFSSRRAAFRSQLPMLAGMVLFSVFSLWLLKQPMLMRTSAM